MDTERRTPIAICLCASLLFSLNKNFDRLNCLSACSYVETREFDCGDRHIYYRSSSLSCDLKVDMVYDMSSCCLNFEITGMDVDRWRCSSWNWNITYRRHQANLLILIFTAFSFSKTESSTFHVLLPESAIIKNHVFAGSRFRTISKAMYRYNMLPICSASFFVSKRLSACSMCLDRSY